MSTLGWNISDIAAIPQLAGRAYSAYKDAPNNYRHISTEEKSLKVLINKTAQYFRDTPLSDSDWNDGQEVLDGCKNVLKDFNSLIKKYNSLAPENTNQVFKKVKLGAEDITTLRTRLISNTVLLHGFIQMFDIPTSTILLSVHTNFHTTAVRCMRCVRCRHRCLRLLMVYLAQTQVFP